MQQTNRVSIVTDSAASLPAQLADESDEFLHVIPHQMVINGTTYREGLDLSPEEFYETLRGLKRPPTTSGPSPDQFAKAFEAASLVSDSVVCLVLSSKFSMTYDSAVVGAREASERLQGTHIEVIDTESATGSGLMVIEALRLSAQGHTSDEIVRRTQELVPRVKVIATLDTLYYLQKGGRVPVLAHLGTSLLQVKPIFEMYRGEVSTIAKVRTAKRAKSKLVDLLREDVGEKRLHAAVLQGNVPDEAQRAGRTHRIRVRLRRALRRDVFPRHRRAYRSRTARRVLLVGERGGLTENVILQLTDLVTTRRCALRIDPHDLDMLLENLLEKYLKQPPLEALRQERRIAEDSEETLTAIQDLVYISSDFGSLTDPFEGVEFLQDGRFLEDADTPHAEPVTIGERDALVVDLQIDRTGVGYDRNWVGFHRRRWDRHSDLFTDFVAESVEARVGAERAKRIGDLESTGDKADFIHALALRIWEADFENYSRFSGPKLVFKTGDETVLNIIGGRGGICSEKVQAVKFLTDHYGLESEYVLSGPATPDPVPEERLRQLLNTLDFRFSKRFMRYWQHLALLYRFDGMEILVDATNGNVPFLFLSGPEAEGVLGYESKRSVRVRMAVKEEDFYYHRISQDIVEDMIFAMEGWIPYVDLVQVFENELGLCITKDYIVAPVVFRTETSFDTMRREYLRVSDEAGLDCEVSDEWGLVGPIGEAFEMEEPGKVVHIMDSYDHLLDRYDEAHGPGHEAGLAVIRLAS